MPLDPEMVAAMEQDRAALLEYLPPLVWGLYQRYRTEGFEHDQALELVANCQTAVIQMKREVIPCLCVDDFDENGEPKEDDDE